MSRVTRADDARRAAVRPARLLRRSLCACLLFVGSAAQAQFGASVGVESDYRFRGVSLSDGQPDLRLSLAYDHGGGAFAGASATRVEFVRGRHAVQWLGYAGYVTRASSDLSVELGVTSSTFSGNRRYDYTELFTGLLSERWSVRAYYAPDYFGFGRATAYVELDANTPLTPRLRLFGHAGALRALRSPAGDERGKTRTDLRVGLGFGVLPSIDVQLSWVTATRAGLDVTEYGTSRNAWVLGVTASF